MDNAVSPDWQTVAERDYFTLRERVMVMQKQLEGAQVYPYSMSEISSRIRCIDAVFPY
ncbi:lysis system i-spanin subunit Rz [Escherichia coli]